MLCVLPCEANLFAAIGAPAVEDLVDDLLATAGQNKHRNPSGKTGAGGAVPRPEGMAAAAEEAVDGPSRTCPAASSRRIASSFAL